MKYILSTMTDSVKYSIFANSDPKMIPFATKHIVVHGGANLPSSTKGFGERTQTEEGLPLWTPRGVVTPIKEEDLALLEDHYVFKIHKSHGHVKVMDKDPGDSTKSIEKAIADMTKRDGAAPLTPETARTGALSVSTEKVE